MKVSKFGGSSLADANQVKKVCDIIISDPDRRIIVVSAPGKINDSDTKMTDLLIECANLKTQGSDYKPVLERIINKYRNIAQGFNLSDAILGVIEQDLEARLNDKSLSPAEFMDSMKASGEDNSAKLVTECLKSLGVNASYLSPKAAGLILKNENGNVSIVESSYETLKTTLKSEGVIIFPGFFGYSSEGKVLTFSRGGSDITGAILAAAVKADVYENFTDVDYIYTVNPRTVKNPKPIYSITYHEMRELSYSGFGVLHDETLLPAEKANVPIHLKNTNNPTNKGTVISNEKTENDIITGIACNKDFVSLTMYKRMMNKEVGFLKRLMDIFYDEKISIEHIPTSIDSISVIVKEEYLGSKLDKIKERIEKELQVDQLIIEKGIAL
ncbi:MAG: aspartate kinase, partial [Papillibacter sp.]|nr:aspartate kinase [Papillibacter sp.]